MILQIQQSYEKSKYGLGNHQDQLFVHKNRVVLYDW